jgi:DNA-binding cell septation regulator SpoVG
MKITNWKDFTKGALRGFFDLELPSGMVLKGCSLFVKDERRWVGMPSKKVGEKYEPTVEFIDKETREKFSALAVKAIDAHKGGEIW